MNQPLVVSDPNVMMRKPVIAGTRITVELILEKLAAGETIDELLQAHQRLSREAVLAALDFAASMPASCFYAWLACRLFLVGSPPSSVETNAPP